MILEKGAPGEVYNVGAEQAYKLDDLLNTIIGFSDQKVEVEVNKDLLRPTDIPFIACNASKAQKELGWKPEHKLEETLREMFVEQVKND